MENFKYSGVQILNVDISNKFVEVSTDVTEFLKNNDLSLNKITLSENNNISIDTEKKVV